MKKRFLLLLFIIGIITTAAACKNDGGEKQKNELKREQVSIAIIDTGISSYVIDSGCILPGKNYLYPDRDTEDRLGHGTACAAFIAGSGPARMDGNCPEAKLVPLVYTDADPETGEKVMGTPELAAQAIIDAVDRFCCDIVLISSGTTENNESLHDAVKYALDKDVLVVSCAGNSGEISPEEVYYPGAYEEVLCVGSLDKEGNIASFSQNNEYVDIWETGTDLRLATLKGTKIRGKGTSYSAAIAAGRAAEAMLQNPEMEIQEIIAILTK